MANKLSLSFSVSTAKRRPLLGKDLSQIPLSSSLAGGLTIAVDVMKGQCDRMLQGQKSHYED